MILCQMNREIYFETVLVFKNSFEEVTRDLPQDRIDIVISVKTHSKYNFAYCLRVERKGIHYCSFHYPFDESSMTYIIYNKVSNIAGIRFRP